MSWKNLLNKESRTWLVTGCAGFIGSHLVEELLLHGQKVIGVDNFATGSQHNLDLVKQATGDAFSHFQFIKGDICDDDFWSSLSQPVDHVLHQAALVSVPLSLKEPVQTLKINVQGFLKVLEFCKNHKAKSLVYASSSAVYGDDPLEQKVETQIGKALSPYAVSKYEDELWAAQYAEHAGVTSTGLRYFNIFGPRQDPNGAYAAVVPKWIAAIQANQCPPVFGTGEATRDFCFVKEVVQANILASLKPVKPASVYNVGIGRKLSLLELYDHLKKAFENQGMTSVPSLEFKEARAGDILHSCSNIESIQSDLEFSIQYDFEEALQQTIVGSELS